VIRRNVDVLALTILWVVLLTGAALTAVLGADILALTVLWVVVLTDAVFLAALADGDTNPDETAGAGALAFIVSGLLTLIYLAAASVALGAGVVAAFVGGIALGTAYLLLHTVRSLAERVRATGGVTSRLEEFEDASTRSSRQQARLDNRQSWLDRGEQVLRRRVDLHTVAHDPMHGSQS
jgi:hypothetical protein